MKPSPSTLITLVAGLSGALLSNGCGHSSPPPRTTRIITPPPVVVQAQPEPRPVVVQNPAPTPVVTQAPAPAPVAPQVTQNTAPAASPTPDPQAGFVAVEDTLGEAAAEVLKMYESGVSEDVISSYTNAAPEPFQLSPEHIIYFTDIGLPDSVITGMIQHDQALGISTPAPEPLAPTPATDSVSPANYETSAPVYAQTRPQSQAPVATPVSTTQTVIVEQRPAVTTQVFYDSLSPYGTWIYLDSYGWTWQPTVATVNVNWRPYYDRGRWAYTDAGWYWHSGYSWGWAPFHYGRWAREPGYGWIWVPGTTWGPSWVSWRYSDAYCGWAPLPPFADYRVGVGFSYRGSRVGVGFGFGLGYSHFSFVSRRNFGRGRHFRRQDRLDNNRVEQVYNDSTVINNYIVGDNNTIINEGISRDRITRGTESEVRQVRLTDVADSGRAADGRGNGRDESIAVYRPKVNDSLASPTKKQLARQEVRATRQKIEERTGRSLAQEPTRRMTLGGGGTSSLASRTASTSGRIAPRSNSKSSSTASLQRQGTTSSTSKNPLLTRSVRGIPNITRSTTTQKPSRPTPTRASRPTTKNSSSGLTKSSVPSNSARITSRNEANAQRAAASRARLESRRNQSQSVTSRSTPTQRSSRNTANARPQRSTPAVTKRSASSTLSQRVAPTYQAPKTRPPQVQSNARSRVQSTPRTSVPSSTRNRVNTQPSRPQRTTPNYRTPSRNEVSTWRPTPSPNTSGLNRMSTQRSQSRQTVPSRSSSTPSYQRRSAPTPSYQAPQRRSSSPSVSRSRSSSSSRRQVSPSRSTRSYSPSVSRTPSRSSAPSVSRSRSSSFSSSRSSSASRSTPQRSRGVPRR